MIKNAEKLIVQTFIEICFFITRRRGLFRKKNIAEIIFFGRNNYYSKTNSISFAYVNKT